MVDDGKGSMKFSKEKFLKNAPADVKRKLKRHVDVLDGTEAVFEGEYGHIPQYSVDGQQYYLYPVYKSWCEQQFSEKRKEL